MLSDREMTIEKPEDIRNSILAYEAFPVMVEFKNQKLHQFLKIRIGEEPPFFVNNVLVKIKKNMTAGTFECFDLKTGINHVIQLPSLSERIVDRFRTVNDDLVIVDVKSVQIWQVVGGNESIIIKQRQHISLPEELASVFSKENRNYYLSFTLKMFPGNRYLGILHNNSIFYRIDCFTGELKKYFLCEEKFRSETFGFIPVSESEIIADLLIPKLNEFRRFYNVKLTETNGTEISLLPAYQYSLYGLGEDYNFYSINHHFIHEIIEVGNSSSNILASITPPRRVDSLRDQRAPVYHFPDLGSLCSIDDYSQKITILASEKNTLKKVTIPIERRDDITHLIQCDERTVVVHHNVKDTMTAIILPDIYYAVLYGMLTHIPEPLIRIITDFLKPELDKLIIHSKDSTIVSHSIFKPKTDELGDQQKTLVAALRV
ncbi:MAG: hypothetical protein ACYCQI_09570 [Gammaproteobacteria bacterium]